MSAPLASSSFLLPELTAIGDAVCQNLELGIEEDILGRSILTRVRPLIRQGRVASSDVVRLALLTDALRVAEVAIAADEMISDAEVAYAQPLVQAAAKRLSSFRQVYAELAHGNHDSARTFLNTHRPDAQLFGGACKATHWLGLEIVRRVAEETSDRAPLDHYSELMLRLSEEIIALKGAHLPAEKVRGELERRLGLRSLLGDAQAHAPTEDQDPRVRAFCAADAPEVFHAVSHASQIWQRDPFDVEMVHEQTRQLFSRLLERAREQADEGTGRVLLVLGEAGSGKTHLMRAFRERVHAGRHGYTGYMQMSSPTDDYGRYILVHLLESLEKPYDAPEVQESGLLCLSDALLMSALAISPDDRRRIRDEELSDEALCDLVFALADQVVCDPRFTDIDVDVIRAFLFLQRREPPVYARVLKFLRCEPFGKRDGALIGDLAPRTRPDDALRLICQIGKLIARVDGGVLVLLVDQLEDMHHFTRPQDAFVRATDAIRHVCDNVPNALIVVACLRDVYGALKQHLTNPVRDRLEQDPEPQYLSAGRTLPEVEAIVSRRLAHLYESLGVRHRLEQPHFPFPRSLLESLATLGAREVFRNLRAFQQRCMDAGEILAAVDDAGAQVKPSRDDAAELEQLEHAWIEHRSAMSGSLDVPEDDAALLDLLRFCLDVAGRELSAPVQVASSLEQHGLVLSVRGASGRQRDALIAMTNKSGRGGGLARQLKSLVEVGQRSGRLPVAVRCSDFSRGAGTQISRQLGEIVRAGGRKVVVDNGTWRSLGAFRSFYDQHREARQLSSWLREQRPLLSLPVIRDLLGVVADLLCALDGPRSAAPSSVSSAPSKRPAPDGGLRREPRPSASEIDVAPTPVGPSDNDGLLFLGTTISLQAKPALLDPEQLKRHAAFLGASGSGKTSLALNVIEQLVARGIGAVLLDRKGDLAGYADRAMWLADAGEDRRRARKQALFARSHVRLFTPGNPAGRSLRIRVVPEGLSALPTHERAQIARYAAQGLGAMMGYKSTASDQTNLAILAKAIEVIAELSGRADLTLRDIIALLAEEDPCLVGELGHLDPKHFKKLVTHLETLRLNHGALLECDDEPLHADVILGCDGSVPAGKVPITIISTKFLGDSERADFWVSQLLVELSRWCSRRPAAELQSVLFLDEADAYMPASSKPATKEPLQNLLKRARSAGLGVMLATQNPGDLDYKSRDTIGTWWIGRIGSKAAVDKMKPLLSECRGDIPGQLATAGIGEFFQVQDGQALRMRSERSLMETVQLSEEQILALAEAWRASAAE